MVKINKEEYELLKSLDDQGQWKWIARDLGDYGGELFVFLEKPIKNCDKEGWLYGRGGFRSVSNHLFQFIQWGDEEPYNIQELIDEYLDDEYGYFNMKLTRELEDSINISEEKEMSKDIEWAKHQIDLRDTGTNDKDDPQFYVDAGLRMALDFLDQLDEPEVLSQEWIDDHAKAVAYDGIPDETEIVYVDELQSLLVPKQEEANQAYKDGYEKGKQHATEKQSEETETVARVFVDYLIASAKLKLALKMEVEELEE